ncbi:hypothetical protein [Aeromonas hydrophila]|uniref:hypothetical protein n=1 Tax=Aeromonas hydrophila TaxID=644 RepID=UPI00225933AB|nr:hypothetical protein [Aeromonas hydrophila]MCX4117196.1 hypothetical protein [Aeromonas hydrophila]
MKTKEKTPKEKNTSNATMVANIAQVIVFNGFFLVVFGCWLVCYAVAYYQYGQESPKWSCFDA